MIFFFPRKDLTLTFDIFIIIIFVFRLLQQILYLVFLHYKFFLTPHINFLCFVVIGKLSTCKTADWTSFSCREGSKVLKKSSSRSGFIFFQILWKSRCNILVTFPSHLNELHSILRSWLGKLNWGFFHLFHSWKNTTTQLFQSKFQSCLSNF